MVAGRHRRNIEDPAVAVGIVVQGLITMAGFALSVWLLLSNYQGANHGMYFLYTMIAAMGPILAFFLGRTVKGWISAYESTPRTEGNFGFFGERIQDKANQSDTVSTARS